LPGPLSDQAASAAPGISLDPGEVIASHRAQLAALPLLADIPFAALEPLLLRCAYWHLPHGAVLLSPGEVNNQLYLLLSGQLLIHLESLASDKGFRVYAGEFVGEVSIIDGMAPTAYVSAAQDCLVVAIPEALLWEDFLRVPGTARNLLRQIAARLRSRNAAMQKSLEESLRLEHLQKELRVAQELQAGMLPMPPLFPGATEIEVEGRMTSAKEVGGDFFDAFALDTGHVCLAIGDVAGKGIPAALFMARAMTLLRTEMLNGRDALGVIHALNRSLSQDYPLCMFVTLMICVLDLRSGRLHYVNGGHNRPLFGSAEQGFRYLEQPKGILVGVDPGAVYELATQDLRAGDMLILYTDGVTEACDTLEEQFTEPRLLEVVNRHRAETAGAMVERVCEAVMDFVSGAEPSDDLTILAARYLGNIS
jgi:sigma-B regulation protein RsbU (phosphoserine phosphatase)